MSKKAIATQRGYIDRIVEPGDEVIVPDHWLDNSAWLEPVKPGPKPKKDD